MSSKSAGSSATSPGGRHKLVYFNGKGRAETIRLVFAAAGISYEDKRIEKQDWPTLKPRTPWGSLPILEVDGKMIGQSVAIARYVAKEAGLSGKSSVEAALIDSVVDALTELREKSFEAFMCKDESKKAKLCTEFFEKTLPTYLTNLENFLCNKNYLVGDAMTLADLHFFAVVEPILGTAPDAFRPYSKVEQLFRRIGGHRPVADYLKSRPKTAF